MTRITILRWGAFALIVSALLTLSGLLLRGPLITDTSNPQVFAESVTTSNNLIAETFLPLSLILQIFGFLGMYAHLDRTEFQKTTFWGMVFSIFGNGLFLPFAGAFAFAIPIAGQLYLDGNTSAIDVATQTLAPGIGLVYLIASAIALAAGSILFSISMWRHGLPRWLPIIYFIQCFGLSFGASIHYGFEIAGGLLLMVFSLSFGSRIWKKD